MVPVEALLSKPTQLPSIDCCGNIILQEAVKCLVPFLSIKLWWNGIRTKAFNVTKILKIFSFQTKFTTLIEGREKIKVT